MSRKRVIISGGGTGGHIYPAVAIANALRSLDPSVEILFVGALGRMEMQKVPAAGYEIIGLPISGIQRKLTISNLYFPFKVVKSLLKARSVIKRFRPHVAIGVGGYASFPLLYIADLLGIATMIQEQNSYAGVANKILSKNCRKICVAYEGMQSFFPQSKLVVTGNPVRKDICNVSDLKDKGRAHFGLKKDLKTILVIGGSLGARTINESVAKGLELLAMNNIQILWQTGKSYYQNNHNNILEMQSDKVKICEFIFEMDLAYGAADIVISRAGALSISELCLVGKPCILVPSPNVAEDHQTKNAKALSSRNAALLITDQEAREKLIQASIDLLRNTEEQRVLSENIMKMARPSAADDIASIVMEIIEKSKMEKK